MMTDIEACCAPGGGENDERYDLAVIGAGSAGFSAAIIAAELGASIALIGHGTISGTCVNTGCVPSKNLIRATDELHQAASGRSGGIKMQARVVDWSAVVGGKNAWSRRCAGRSTPICCRPTTPSPISRGERGWQMAGFWSTASRSLPARLLSPLAPR